MTNTALLSLSVTDKAALYASYMPFIQGGGLFVPTSKLFQLGDEVFILLQLNNEDSTSESLAIAGKVVWLTPHKPQGYVKPGIGIQFSSSGIKALNRLEKFIGKDWLNSDKKTFTL